MNESNDISPWFHWIERSIILSPEIDYDKRCDQAIAKFNLTVIHKSYLFVDEKQFFCLWWMKNRCKMKRYRLYEDLAEALKMKSHSGPYYLIHTRVGTRFYKENTQCIRKFLES